MAEESRQSEQKPSERGPENSGNGKIPYWKCILFSLLPACILLVGAEIAVRMAWYVRPELRTIPLPEEYAGLLVRDTDVFWSLRPNLNTTYEGARVTSNSLGLRSPEVSVKRNNEFRILSLGESSTFGVGVSNDETYTALLPQLLQKRFPSRTFTALNGGVSAWSSFQSLKYLELRGLKLKPDLVLFYHELNDYLPSTLRDSSNKEIGVRKTDQELYESRGRTVCLSFIRVSALLLFLRSHYEYWTIQRFEQEHFTNPLLTIGLPDIGIKRRLVTGKGQKWSRTKINEVSLGRRVSEQERCHNLSKLMNLCRTNHVALVIIHPSYRSSRRHECLLTRFCQNNGVLMYEAHDALHPPGRPHGALYRDSWHPNAEGHRRIAEGLAKFLEENLLVHQDKSDNRGLTGSLEIQGKGVRFHQPVGAYQ